MKNRPVDPKYIDLVLYNSKENQSVSEAMKKEPLKKTVSAIPGHSSSQKFATNGSKQNRPLNNTTCNTKSGTPQSQNAKIGKKNNNFK